jgi:L-threonylcarbamoyladenylate synthase
VPEITTAGRDAIALRVPAHPVALALLRAVGAPLAAPSANRFTEVSPTTAQHVMASLAGRVSLVLDGGPSRVGIESTVLDLTGDAPRVLRPGMVGAAVLGAVLGAPVTIATALHHETTDEDTAVRASAPGQAARHYAPRACVWLFEPPEWPDVARALRAHQTRQLLLSRSPAHVLPAPHRTVAMPDTPDGYAARLYAELRDADARDEEQIAVELPPDAPDWLAVRDRLTRAAHPA